MNHPPEIINLEAIVPEKLANSRFDRALAQLFPQYSRTRMKQWIQQDQVQVNGQLLRPRDRLCGGETITINAILEAEENWAAQARDLVIVYEDASILVINKPAGLVAHPAAGNREGTLLNALLHYLPALQLIPRAGIIHRLDKDTSGLLVIAKTLPAHHHLIKQFSDRSIKRDYLAITNGVMISGGTVDEPIGRHPTQRTRMAVTNSGKTAITHYRVVERFRSHTLVKASLQTGRTHQIRVHLAHIHYSLVGDKTYGGRLHIPKGASAELGERLRHFGRQALHAYELKLIHPETNEMMQWTAEMPSDMQELIKILREDLKHA